MVTEEETESTGSTEGTEGTEATEDTRSSLSDGERSRMERERELARKRFQGLDQALKQDRRYLYEEEEVKKIRSDHKKELTTLRESHAAEITQMRRDNNLRLLMNDVGLDPDFAKLVDNAEFDDQHRISNAQVIVENLWAKLAGTPAAGAAGPQQPQQSLGETRIAEAQNEFEKIGNVFNR